MKEPHGEGVAIHTGPESCGWTSDGVAEALTGVRAGQVLSHEIKSGVPTLWDEAEGNTAWLDMARGRRTLRGRRPCARAETLHAGTGRSHVCLGLRDSRRPHWEV